MSTQILEDIEEAIAREIRRISFSEDRIRTTTIFKEVFDPFTGELKRKPIEPRFYDDEALPREIAYPQFTISLLKLYEDLDSKRLVPAIGNEHTTVLPGPQAYEVIIGGELDTTNGGSDSDVMLTHLNIKKVSVSHLLRITTGNNKGTYRIDSISLNGNGPHTIVLSNDLLTDLPDFEYSPDTGIVTFRDFVDLSVVKAGDELIDAASNTFVITAVNVTNATLAIGTGNFVARGTGATIHRIGDVLQGDDAGVPQCYLILDPSKPVANKGTKYRSESWAVPYSFLYYIKIVSTERDDHIAIADRMMQVFNPARGALPTIIRCDNAAESLAKKDITAGDQILYVENASKFYVNEKLHLFSNVDFGEDLVIKSVNPLSNAITVMNPVTKSYKINDEAQVVSNYEIRFHERDFRNHITEDDSGMQFWVHRFTYRVEAWVDSRIPPYTTNQTYEDSREVNFVKAALEDFEGNPL